MSEENTQDNEANKRFDYSIGMFRDANGTQINQINSKERISTLDLASAYLDLINKNAIQTKNTYYAEDLIKKFPFLSIRRLKGNVTKVLRILGEGIQERHYQEREQGKEIRQEDHSGSNR